MHNTLLKRFLNSCSNNRKSKTCTELRRSIQNRKWAGLFAIVVALTVCGARAEAQHRSPDRVKRNPGLVLSLLDSAALRPAYELRFQALQWR